MKTAHERVKAVAEGGTINGTYGLMPGAALAAFREDLLTVLGLPVRIWTPHKDFSGEDMLPGAFREPQCEQCELVDRPELKAKVCRICATGVRE